VIDTLGAAVSAVKVTCHDAESDCPRSSVTVTETGKPPVEVPGHVLCASRDGSVWIDEYEGRVSKFSGTDEPLHDALMGVQELLVAITNLETQLRPIQKIERDFEVVRECVAQLDVLARTSQSEK
jgi:hypothetical protein